MLSIESILNRQVNNLTVFVFSTQPLDALSRCKCGFNHYIGKLTLVAAWNIVGTLAIKFGCELQKTGKAQSCVMAHKGVAVAERLRPSFLKQGVDFTK